MSKLFGCGELSDSRSSSSKSRGKPAAWITLGVLVFVICTPFKAFSQGTNCEQLLEESVRELRLRSSRNNSNSTLQDEEKRMRDDFKYADSFYASRPRSEQNEKRMELAADLDKFSKMNLRGNDVALAILRWNICLLDRIQAGNRANSNQSNANQAGGQAPNALQSQTQESQQRARDAQARADAQRSSQPQTAGTNPLQSQTQESQQRARDAQMRADAAAQRSDKRVHDTSAEAHECLEADFASSNGGFKNKCNYDVTFGYCVENPRAGSFADTSTINCTKLNSNVGGGQLIKANSTSQQHTKGGSGVRYYACKRPSEAIDLAYNS